MPGIEDNRATWNAPASWTGQGEQWSGPWDSADAQWWGSLLPRLHRFVPTGRIVELGPGHGRWSRYLKDLCEELILVDVAENCIAACRERFAAATNITYLVSDGRSLPEVGDRSVDLIFSFDSLVHAEADVLEAYLRELARVLAADGVAFVHHSNMGALRRQADRARRVPDGWRRRLAKHGILVNTYAWRAESTTAEWFARECSASGLSCIGQELIAWHYGRYLTDTISLVARPGSRWDRQRVVVRNRGFMEEARMAREVERIYGGGSGSSV
jgi:SAM-dependent methyltransferase